MSAISDDHVVAGPTGDDRHPVLGRLRANPRPAWVSPALTGAVVGAGCVAIALTDPGDSGVPLCLSRAVFGIDCPLCGGLRCVNSLMRGNWAAAADHNVLAAVVLPMAAIAWIVWMIAAIRGHRVRTPTLTRPMIFGLVALLLAFTVLRNVGGPAWVDWLAAASYRS